MAHDEGDGRDGRHGGGLLRRTLGLATVVGAVALWRQRQRRREDDEDLWGEPEDR
ncbi:MAG: hypothetical protein ACO4BW_05335 [Nitriliruptoraceae bacterium]